MVCQYFDDFREFLRAATKIRPHIVLDTIKSGEALAVKEGVKLPIKGTCKKCDYISSQEYCKEPLFYGQRRMKSGIAKILRCLSILSLHSKYNGIRLV